MIAILSDIFEYIINALNMFLDININVGNKAFTYGGIFKIIMVVAVIVPIALIFTARSSGKE